MEGIVFLSYQKGWKKFEKNNTAIPLNILFVQHDTKQIKPAYKSKYNNNREDQVILLMITDGTKWRYFALKSERIFYGGKWCNRAKTSFSRLLREITSNYHGDFYCLNCYHL